MVNPYAYQHGHYSNYDVAEKGSRLNDADEALPDGLFFDIADGLPDEVFEESESFAEESETEEGFDHFLAHKPQITPKPAFPIPTSKPSFYQDEFSDETFEESVSATHTDQPDRIENITGQIFLHLICLADGTRRDELEDALAAEIDRPASFVESKLSHTHRFRPFEKETYFSGFNLDQQPVHTQNVIYNILGAVTNIFLGWQLLEKDDDQRTVEELKKGLKSDFFTWNKVLKSHYTESLCKQMEMAFDDASGLLETREADERWAMWQRVVFYSSLVSLGASKLVGKPAFVILSGIACSVTVIFMIIHYGNSSFNRAKLATDLKSLIETIYSGAYQYRLSPQTLAYLADE